MDPNVLANSDGLEEGEIEDDMDERECFAFPRVHSGRPKADIDERKRVIFTSTANNESRTFRGRVVNEHGRTRSNNFSNHWENGPVTRSDSKLDRFPWYNRAKQHQPYNVPPRTRPPPPPPPQLPQRPQTRSTMVTRSKMRMSPLANRRKLKGTPEDAFSYEDLLAQYKDIQSKLEDIQREEAKSESSARLDDNLDKENCKADVRRSSKGVRDGRHTRVSKADRTAAARVIEDSPTTDSTSKTGRRSRTRAHLFSSSSGGSSNPDLKHTQEDDDEQELRRIALASTRRTCTSADQLGSAEEVPGEEVPLLTDAQEPSIHDHDNYDEVEMELDSNCDSPIVEVFAEEDDEYTLRNNLLLALKSKPTKEKPAAVKKTKEKPAAVKKVKEKLAEAVNNQDESLVLPLTLTDATAETTESATTETAEIVNTAKPAKIEAKAPPPPKHKPVVINLAEDSSDSDTEGSHQSHVKSIDRLLKEARQKTEVPQTRAAVLRLSEAQVEEYCRLKEEIKKREQVVKPVPPTAEKIYEQKLQEVKLLVSKDEQELRMLQMLLVKKRALLSASEHELKRFQEQMAVAQRAVAANRNSVHKITTQMRNVQKRISEKRSQLLGVNITEPTKKRAATPLSQVPSKRQRVLSRSRTPPADRLSMTPQQMAEEKARLQRREQEVLARLKELRQTQELKDESTRPRLAWKEKSEANVISVVPAVPKESAKQFVAVVGDKPVSDVRRSEELKEILDQRLKPLVDQRRCSALPLTPFLLDSMVIGWKPRFDEAPIGEAPCKKRAEGDAVNKALPPEQPLNHLRSFRLSKLFSGSVSSATYTHKMDPNWTMCSFDLLGTCNDDQCPWQHSRDYLPKPEDVIADLVSYCLPLCAVDKKASVETIEKAVGDYVRKQLKGTANSSTVGAACSEILKWFAENQTSDLRVQTEPRVWRPQQAVYNCAERPSKNASSEATSASDDDQEGDVASVDEDEVRYFSNEYQQVETLEAQVTKDPHDLAAWQKLVKAQRQGSRSKEKLDQELNVLSRALESNQHDSDLWSDYLELYEHHPDSGADIDQLRQQALTFAPSPKLWWKSLARANSYLEKMNVCSQMLEYLQPLNEPLAALDVIMVQVQLQFHLGLHSEALRLLQVELTNSTNLAGLSANDTVLAWLVYIHIGAFNSFPTLLLTDKSDSPGRLVNKLPFLMDWTGSAYNPDVALQLLTDALTSCSGLPLSALVPLHANMVEFSLAQGKIDVAEMTAHLLVTRADAPEEAWLLQARVAKVRNGVSGCASVLNEALVQCPRSFRLHLVAAAMAIKHTSTTDPPRDSLRRVITASYVEEELPEPDILYRHRLGLSVPLVRQTLVEADVGGEAKVYIWLCYALWLCLDGRREAAIYAMEVALARLQETRSQLILWMYYLCLWDEMAEVSAPPLARCLQSVCLHPNWYQASLLEFVASGCANAEMTSSVLRRVYSWLPKSATVLTRLVRHLVAEGACRPVEYFTKKVTKAGVRSLEAARVCLWASSKWSRSKKLNKLCCQLTRAMPYSLCLWQEVYLANLSRQNVAGTEALRLAGGKWDPSVLEAIGKLVPQG